MRSLDCVLVICFPHLGLRVTRAEAMEGLDPAQHNEEGYVFI